MSNKSVPRSKSWCFTTNNYSNDEPGTTLERLRAVALLVVIGKEIAPGTGTPHLQGYVQFTERKRFEQVKNYFQLEATLSQLKGILNKTWIIVQSQATLSNTAHSQPENIRLSIWCVKNLRAELHSLRSQLTTQKHMSAIIAVWKNWLKFLANPPSEIGRLIVLSSLAQQASESPDWQQRDVDLNLPTISLVASGGMDTPASPMSSSTTSTDGLSSMRCYESLTDTPTESP